MTQETSAELAAVRDLALQAGRILLDSMGRVGRIDQKAGNEFVTEVDTRVEDMLVTELRRRFPGDAILAEESGANPGSGGRTWYIDPLDGTTNYAHGYPFFSVSLACGDASGLQLGVVFAPYLDELYLARAGSGAVMERPRHGETRALPRRGPVDLERALLATGFPYRRDGIVDVNTALVAHFLKANCHGVRRGGSAAIDLVHVACGKLDGYWEWRLRPWDTAAGALIAREAGALVTDFLGRDVSIPTEHVVAAPPGLHERMRMTLGPAAGAVAAAAGSGTTTEVADEH